MHTGYKVTNVNLYLRHLNYFKLTGYSLKNLSVNLIQKVTAGFIILSLKSYPGLCTEQPVPPPRKNKHL